MLPISVAALALAACTKTPAYVYGRDFSSLKFTSFSTNEGIYPDTSILNDPNNPFAIDPPTDQGKWLIEANGGPAAAFYSWATLNAITPNGEAQFYTGHDLEQIFRTGKASASQLPVAHDLAVRAYQAVLDNFPTSLTYDASGKIAYSLSTLALQGIVGLGGMVQGGWILVKSDDGSEHAVHP
jgi:hypothetical protein